MSRLRGAIASLGGGPYTVMRTAAGSYVKGVYSSGPAAHTIADDVIEAVDATEDTLTLTAHGLETGDGPIQLTVSALGTLPGGLALVTDYWVIVVDDNTIQLAASLEDATTVVDGSDVVAGVPLDITSAGSGTFTLSDTADTERQNREWFAMPVASIQPVTGEDLKNLPESQRIDATCVVYTQTELRSRKKTPATDPDVVMYRGEPWLVVKAEFFEAFGDTHYRAYISRTESP